MAKLQLSESPGFAVIPEGEVLQADVKIVGEKIMPWKDDNGNQVRRMEFEFIITDDKFTGRRIWGSTPMTFSDNPDCKLRGWVQELLGEDSLPAGFVVDTDELEDLACRVEIGNYEGKDGKLRDRVEDVIRAKVNKPSVGTVNASVSVGAVKVGTDDEEII